MKKNETNMNDKVELTVEEIQAIMDHMDKRTFGATTSMEWEGSIQNAPKMFEEKE